jgi:hypothetical protein
MNSKGKLYPDFFKTAPANGGELHYINVNAEYKLGATPQLERWNSGILESWVLASGSESIMEQWV